MIFINLYLYFNFSYIYYKIVAVVLLSIPAFQRENYLWFQSWKGQWAQISLVLWL